MLLPETSDLHNAAAVSATTRLPAAAQPPADSVNHCMPKAAAMQQPASSTTASLSLQRCNSQLTCINHHLPVRGDQHTSTAGRICRTHYTPTPHQHTSWCTSMPCCVGVVMSEPRSPVANRQNGWPERVVFFQSCISFHASELRFLPCLCSHINTQPVACCSLRWLAWNSTTTTTARCGPQHTQQSPGATAQHSAQTDSCTRAR